VSFNYNYNPEPRKPRRAEFSKSVNRTQTDKTTQLNISSSNKKRRVLPDYVVSTTVTLPRHVVDRIDAILGSPGRPTGFRSGRANWIRKLVYTALSMEEMPDGKERVDHLHSEYMKRADTSLLETMPEREQKIIARIIELRSRGLTYPEIADAMGEEGFTTVSGKRWLPGTVHYYLQKLIR
jgi:hypothetical protein